MQHFYREKAAFFKYFGFYLDLEFTFEKIFELWLDLDWVLKNQDRIWIKKFVSPLISAVHHHSIPSVRCQPSGSIQRDVRIHL